MATCVYYFDCGSVATVFFKGRMFCIDHAREIQNKIRQVIFDKEKRENRVIPENEEIAINNQRELRTPRGLIPIRGTRFVITKADVRRMISLQYNDDDGTIKQPLSAGTMAGIEEKQPELSSYRTYRTGTNFALPIGKGREQVERPAVQKSMHIEPSTPANNIGCEKRTGRQAETVQRQTNLYKSDQQPPIMVN